MKGGLFMNNEYLEKEFDRPEGPERHHSHHRHRPHPQPIPLNEAMIESADLDILFRICEQDKHMADAKFGMSQDAILRELNKKEEISQKDLMHKLHVRPGSMSEIITKMEEKGLLVREKDDEDRRHAILHITNEGRIAAQNLGEPESFFDVLNDDEQEQLAQLLRKVVKARHL